jgi:hypothetical protein
VKTEPYPYNSVKYAYAMMREAGTRKNLTARRSARRMCIKAMHEALNDKRQIKAADREHFATQILRQTVLLQEDNEEWKNL